MGKTQQIVIIEDDKDLNTGLCKALKDDSRSIVSLSTLKEAREQIGLTQPALVILDINLPDGNGLDLLKEIKAKDPRISVIMLSANDTDADIVKGLDYGADDYVTKPFSLSVLRARVNTQLRKNEAARPSDEITLGRYRFDFGRMIFMAGDEEIVLSKTEQKLLKMFVSNPGITLGREELLDRIWSEGSDFVDENALSVAVKRLRDKLDAKDLIKTVYGLGYMWVKENA
jgi:DNA-binding response OmpR family regulator